MSPSDLLTMFLIWFDIAKGQENRPTCSEEMFAGRLEMVLPEFGIGFEILESKNSYYLEKGPYRFKFKRFRLSLLGMKVLYRLYRKANKS